MTPCQGQRPEKRPASTQRRLGTCTLIVGAGSHTLTEFYYGEQMWMKTRVNLDVELMATESEVSRDFQRFISPSCCCWVPSPTPPPLGVPQLMGIFFRCDPVSLGPQNEPQEPAPLGRWEHPPGFFSKKNEALMNAPGCILSGVVIEPKWACALCPFCSI